MFNLDDMNLSEESLDFIQGNTEEQEQETQGQEVQQDITPDNPTPPVEEPKQEAHQEEEEKEVETGDEKETIENKSEDTPSSDKDDSSQSALYTLAKHLKEEGVLYLDEDISKVESLEDLKALIAKSNEKAKYAGLNESQRRYQEALENGIPQKDYEEVEKEIQKLSSIDEEAIKTNEQLRFEINAIDLMEKGIEREKAIKLAKLALADESNVDDTREALQNLIEAKKAKFEELIQENKKQTELALNDIKKTIYEREKYLDTPLNDITKNKLFDLMTTKVETDDEGRPLNEFQKWQKENPLEAQVFVNYMWMMTNKGKDLGLIKKSSDSKATRELEKKLNSMNFDKDGSLILPEENINPRNNNKGFSTGDLQLNI